MFGTDSTLYVVGVSLEEVHGQWSPCAPGPVPHQLTRRGPTHGTLVRRKLPSFPYPTPPPPHHPPGTMVTILGPDNVLSFLWWVRYGKGPGFV